MQIPDGNWVCKLLRWFIEKTNRIPLPLLISRWFPKFQLISFRHLRVTGNRVLRRCRRWNRTVTLRLNATRSTKLNKHGNYSFDSSNVIAMYKFSLVSPFPITTSRPFFNLRIDDIMELVTVRPTFTWSKGLSILSCNSPPYLSASFNSQNNPDNSLLWKITVLAPAHAHVHVTQLFSF